MSKFVLPPVLDHIDPNAVIDDFIADIYHNETVIIDANVIKSVIDIMIGERVDMLVKDYFNQFDLLGLLAVLDNLNQRLKENEVTQATGKPHKKEMN